MAERRVRFNGVATSQRDAKSQIEDRRRGHPRAAREQTIGLAGGGRTQVGWLRSERRAGEYADAAGELDAMQQRRVLCCRRPGNYDKHERDDRKVTCSRTHWAALIWAARSRRIAR